MASPLPPGSPYTTTVADADGSAAACRVLVTGATGYVGARVARALQAAGHEVHVLARPQSSLQQLGSAGAGIQVHRCDGSAAALAGVLGEVRPEVVHHLAARTAAAHAPGDAEALTEANLGFGSRLLQAMLGAGCHRLVNAESFWQFGSQGGIERPNSLYAAAKAAFTTLVRYHADYHGLQVASLVLFDNYGPGDPRPKLLAALRRAAATGQAMELTAGEQLIDLCHVDDVAAAFVRACALLLASPAGHGWQRHAVASGRRMRVRELVALIEHACGVRIEARWGARPYRPNEIMRPWEGSAVPGWTPAVALESGLRDYFAEAA